MNTTFQCYFGSCIPRYALCDKHRDCPGKFYEDEHESICSTLLDEGEIAFEFNREVRPHTSLYRWQRDLHFYFEDEHNHSFFMKNQSEFKNRSKIFRSSRNTSQKCTSSRANRRTCQVSVNALY